MDNFGDLLYVLIGVAWLLYSFFKKKKSKQQPYSPTEQNAYEEKEEYNDESQLYEEEQYKEEPISKEEILKKIFNPIEEPAEAEPEPEPVIKYTAKSKSSAKQSIVPDVPKPSKVTHDESEELEAYADNSTSISDEEESDENDFDLKEAVVNSIILKRPDY